MKKTLIIILLLLFDCISLLSADSKDLWIFGKGASLKFDSPISLPYAISNNFF